MKAHLGLIIQQISTHCWSLQKACSATIDKCRPGFQDKAAKICNKLAYGSSAVVEHLDHNPKIEEYPRRDKKLGK